jgi:hypothetical protein
LQAVLVFFFKLQAACVKIDKQARVGFGVVGGYVDAVDDAVQAVFHQAALAQQAVHAVAVGRGLNLGGVGLAHGADRVRM